MARKSKKTQAGDNNVPLNGGEAWRLKFTAADCPYSEEHDQDEFDRWNEEFDEAADEAQESKNEEGSEEAGMEVDKDAGEDGGEGDVEEAEKSVVKAEYRARYAEAGHPAHCGDELAVLINNLCLAKAGFDIPRFEAICAANGVDLSKYNRTTNGWQGRLRMTGRNVLAGKVFAAGGVVKTPVEGAEAEYKMSEEWMANRRKPHPSLAYGQAA
jgi:hypothetical protein